MSLRKFIYTNQSNLMYVKNEIIYMIKNYGKQFKILKTRKTTKQHTQRNPKAKVWKQLTEKQEQPIIIL